MLKALLDVLHSTNICPGKELAVARLIERQMNYNINVGHLTQHRWSDLSPHIILHIGQLLPIMGLPVTDSEVLTHTFTARFNINELNDPSKPLLYEIRDSFVRNTAESIVGDIVKQFAVPICIHHFYVIPTTLRISMVYRKTGVWC